MSMILIEFESVTKYYNANVGVKDLSFKIDKGTFNLFIGGNGSGKSTTIKLLLGLIKLKKHDEGKINIYTNKIGYVPEKVMLPHYISVKDFLTELNEVENKRCNWENYLDYFSIDKNKLMISLSKGMRQKVGIIQAIMCDNDLIVFDEPTDGLDKEAVNKFMLLLNKLKKDNKTIIVSTHIEKAFQKLADKTFFFKLNELNVIS